MGWDGTGTDETVCPTFENKRHPAFSYGYHKSRMSAKSFLTDPKLHEYTVAHSLREVPILRRLREETAIHPRAIMQIPPEQGELLGLLLRAAGARRVLEVGVFTGYSSLAMALALPPDGRIVACDVSEEYTSVARRYWKEAGVEGKIDLRIAPARETLQALIAAGHAGGFDFAFIDADKPSYPEYYELALQLLRTGGLMALDNMLQRGAVVDPSDTAENTVVIRNLNAYIAADLRVFATLLPLGDGVTLVIKK